MVRRGTYYKQDGEPMHGLPMTEAAQRYYLEKGFTLTPPGTPLTPPPPESSLSSEPQGEFVCEICGRDDFKARIGLIGHQRVCKKEDNE